MNGYKTRHIYQTSKEGKRKAIENLEYALSLENRHPWFVSIAQRTGYDVKFSNWVLQTTKEEILFCIKHASREIMFYEMPLDEIDPTGVDRVNEGYLV
jgi:hypothetical protein